MPIKIVAWCCAARSSVGSLKPGEKGPQNGVCSTSLYPDDCQSMNDFERQLQELFDDIKQMIRMGNKNDATDLLKANYEMVNKKATRELPRETASQKQWETESKIQRR